MNVFFQNISPTPRGESSIFIQPTQIYYTGMETVSLTFTENSPAPSHLVRSFPLGLFFLEVWVRKGYFDPLNGAMVKAVTSPGALVQAFLSSQGHGL